MQEATPSTSDDQVDHALIDLMRATDAFVSSWAIAVRRFAEEPAALTRFRELQQASPPPPADISTIGMPLLLHPHPLWDRDLDG